MDHSTPSQTDVDQFIDVINQAKADGGEVYGHCREGRDRTGYMMACAQEKLLGTSPQEAFADDVAHGYNAYKQQKYPGLNILTDPPVANSTQNEI